jgi:hypothetical protein
MAPALLIGASVLDRTSIRTALRLALCIIVLTAGGCSYVFVDGPPKNHAQLPYFECSSSKAWPVVDAVMAASLGLAATAAFADGGSSSNDTSEGFVAAAEAAAFAISALSGYQKVAECREAKEDLVASLGSRTRYAAAPGFRAPPPDPWVHPPPGLFAPRVNAPPPGTPPAAAPAPGDVDEPDATATEMPDSVPARPLPSIPAPAVDPETPR